MRSALRSVAETAAPALVRRKVACLVARKPSRPEVTGSGQVELAVDSSRVQCIPVCRTASEPSHRFESLTTDAGAPGEASPGLPTVKPPHYIAGMSRFIESRYRLAATSRDGGPPPRSFLRDRSRTKCHQAAFVWGLSWIGGTCDRPCPSFGRRPLLPCGGCAVHKLRFQCVLLRPCGRVKFVSR